MMACSSIVFPYFLNANWKAYAVHPIDGDDGKKIVNQDWILSVLITVGSLTNSSGKLFFGSLMRFYRYKYIFLVQNCIQLVTSISINFIGDNQALYIIIICYAFMCIGSNTAIFPVLCKNVFGPIVGPKVYPYVYVFFSMASLLQWGIFQYISKSYSVLFNIFAGFTVFAIIIVLIFNENPNWTVANQKELERIKAKEPKIPNFNSTIKAQKEDPEVGG